MLDCVNILSIINYRVIFVDIYDLYKYMYYFKKYFFFVDFLKIYISCVNLGRKVCNNQEFLIQNKLMVIGVCILYVLYL